MVTSESLNKALTALPLALSAPNAVQASCWERWGFSPHPPSPPLPYLTLFPLSFNCGTLNNTFKHSILVTSGRETHTLLSLPSSLSSQMFHYLYSKGRLKQFMYKLPCEGCTKCHSFSEELWWTSGRCQAASAFLGCPSGLVFGGWLGIRGTCWRGQLLFTGPFPALGVFYANGYQTPLGWYPTWEDLFLRAVSGSKSLSLWRKSAPWYQTLPISKAVMYTVQSKSRKMITCFSKKGDDHIQLCVFRFIVDPNTKHPRALVSLEPSPRSSKQELTYSEECLLPPATYCI